MEEGELPTIMQIFALIKMRLRNLTLAGGFVLALCSCMEHTQMKHSDFWKTIDIVAGRNTDEEKVNELSMLLSTKTPIEIIEFQRQLNLRMDESNTSELYAAAKLINVGSCSDDCFEYFRYWLISMGSTVYARAIADPDSLANVKIPFEDGIPVPLNESFGYVAADVFRKSTGKDVHEELRKLYAKSEIKNLRNSAVTGNHHLPRLQEKYGKFSGSNGNRFSLDSTESQLGSNDVKGIGTVSVGTKIRHKRFGLGIVEALVSNAHGAMIRFDDGVRFIVLSSEFVELVSDSDNRASDK